MYLRRFFFIAGKLFYTVTNTNEKATLISYHLYQLYLQVNDI